MLGAKFIMFHDIANVNTRGARIAWNQIKKNHSKTYEFVDQYEMNGKYLGLGIVQVDKNDSIFPMFKPNFHHLFDW